MEMPNDTGHNTFLYFIMTIVLTAFGELGNFIKSHSEIVNAITLLFQWFAWSGAGIVGVITFIKFLQDNGWIKKGKK